MEQHARMNRALIHARQLIGRHGSSRARELEAAGIARAQLSRMVARGELVRLARGLYALPDRQSSEDEALEIVAQRAPQAFFCLLTALRFHALTTQAPSEVWIGIGTRDRVPRLDWPQLQAVRYSGIALETGIEAHDRGRVALRVTSVARTVVDCFKFRNRIGLDLALESLRETVRERRASIDEVWRQARLLRMANVMRPYLEAQS
jgi:predicted transcriptional regulator of viral defense system